MRISFKPSEYTAEGKFHKAEYTFEGDADTGWRISRNGREHMILGKGYRLLQSRLCGICSTDLARKFLPFPLPQVIGHEVVAADPGSMEKCVVEINDTPYFRGEKIQDVYCRSGLHTHSPERMVLGIDRLPGGFGAYILAPKNSIIPLQDLNEDLGVLVEPFAAAFHAITASPPQRGDSVAVLGPRRLGSLLIAGLKAYRHLNKIDFQITAVSKHEHLLEICKKLGSDHEVDLTEVNEKSLEGLFDMVYDTTGSESGLLLALKSAKREVHVKSTSGRRSCGFENLTSFVVDELSIFPFCNENIDFAWPGEKRENSKIYATDGTGRIEIPGKDVFRGSIQEACRRIESSEFANRLPHFDVAIASSAEEIDRIIRPFRSKEVSILKPRGALLFLGDPTGNPLLRFISGGGRIRSSRCGDFHDALSVLKKNSDIAGMMTRHLISHVFPAYEIEKAFQYAAEKEAIKVVITHF